MATSAEVRKQSIGYIVTALGLVVGLAWNDAISSFISSIFPFGKGQLISKFIYAAVLTVFVVLLTPYIMRLGGGEK